MYHLKPPYLCSVPKVLLWYSLQNEWFLEEGCVIVQAHGLPPVANLGLRPYSAPKVPDGPTTLEESHGKWQSQSQLGLEGKKGLHGGREQAWVPAKDMSKCV